MLVSRCREEEQFIPGGLWVKAWHRCRSMSCKKKTRSNLCCSLVLSYLSRSNVDHLMWNKFSLKAWKWINYFSYWCWTGPLPSQLKSFNWVKMFYKWFYEIYFSISNGERFSLTCFALCLIGAVFFLQTCQIFNVVQTHATSQQLTRALDTLSFFFVSYFDLNQKQSDQNMNIQCP